MTTDCLHNTQNKLVTWKWQQTPYATLDYHTPTSPFIKKTEKKEEKTEKFQTKKTKFHWRTRKWQYNKNKIINFIEVTVPGFAWWRLKCSRGSTWISWNIPRKPPFVVVRDFIAALRSCLDNWGHGFGFGFRLGLKNGAKCMIKEET